MNIVKLKFEKFLLALFAIGLVTACSSPEPKAEEVEEEVVVEEVVVEEVDWIILEDGFGTDGPGERISVDRAMRAITIDAAYILGVEDQIGSLEPGKFEVDPMDLKDVLVWGTALAGKIFEATE